MESSYDYETIKASTEKEIQDVYASHNPISVNPSHNTQEMRFVDAISDGLKEARTMDDTLVVMGQDVGDYGGVLRLPMALLSYLGQIGLGYSPCESAILSASLGYSIAGCKSVVEMQFADFVSSGFTVIAIGRVTLLGAYSKWVVRMPTGAGVGLAPIILNPMRWFTHCRTESCFPFVTS